MTTHTHTYTYTHLYPTISGEGEPVELLAEELHHVRALRLPVNEDV